ncbi:MAG: peptidase M48 [Hyphomicrobium sp.]|nr:peptidase M48 [Hyphomicrobium sp.]PPC83934.1 MAG: peptidase M48 [Hyphomicrobium sp.]
MSQRKAFVVAAALALMAAVPVLAREPDDGGVKIGRKSYLAKLISAEKIEQSSALQYDQMTRQAFQKRALVEPDHPQAQRLKRIFKDLEPHTLKFNERAKDWKWEVSLINSPQINAFCMPGGKIAFFTGILEKLKLTDDEAAMIMGHEMGHALWEHARERAAKTNITNIGSRVVGGLLFGQAGEVIGAAGASLATLKFSRNDETEADLIGLELAARAGYDPRAGITLWEKMSAASKGAPPQWLSTHPSGSSRIDTIKKNLPDVMPLYERAKAKRAG